MPKSEVTVQEKEPDHLNELYIADLSISYSSVYHVGSTNETRIDMHIKRNEAKALYNALKEKLENQVVSPSVDR